MLPSFGSDFGFLCLTRKRYLGIGVLLVERGLVKVLGFEYDDDEGANFFGLGHDERDSTWTSSSVIGVEEIQAAGTCVGLYGVYGLAVSTTQANVLSSGPTRNDQLNAGLECTSDRTIGQIRQTGMSLLSHIKPSATTLVVASECNYIIASVDRHHCNISLLTMNPNGG